MDQGFTRNAAMVIETATLDTWDIVTICVYFAIVMAVGLIVSMIKHILLDRKVHDADVGSTWLPNDEKFHHKFSYTKKNEICLCVNFLLNGGVV